MPTVSEGPLVELTRKLVSYPSINPPGNEGPITEFLAGRLRDSHANFEIRTQEVESDRPNVVARAGNPEYGTLLLTGHVDVVPAVAENWSYDPFELTRTDDRVIGRGVSDMKGAIAAKILAAESYLSDTSDPGEVILAFAVGEETTGFGSKALVEDGIQADAAVLGEPTDGQIAIAQKGVVRYNVSVRGTSAHSARPDEGRSAVGGVRVLLNRLNDLDASVRQETHQLLTPGSVSVTELESGIAPNVIPDAASLTIDWRVVPGSEYSTPADFDNRLHEIVTDVADNGKALTVDFDRWIFARATEISLEEYIVGAITSAAEDAGVKAEITGFDASTDARHFIHRADIPTVLFGPGSVNEDAHSVDESISVADLVTTQLVYRRTLERFLESDEESQDEDRQD